MNIAHPTPRRAAAPPTAGDGAEDAIGTFDYPKGSTAHAEIHRELTGTTALAAFDAGLKGDAAERRAAQLAILGLVKAAPIELFRELRSERPVLELPDLDLYLVTRDRDVREILHNPTVFTVRDYRDRMEPVVGPYMLNRDSDPYFNMEEKPWMRSLMHASDLARIRDTVRTAAALALRNAASAREIDVVAALGRAVPVRVVQDYFGFRAAAEDLLRWSFLTQDSFFHNVGYVRGLRGAAIRRFGVGGEALQKSQIEAHRVHEAAIAAGEEMRAFLDDDVASRAEALQTEETILGRMLAVNDRLAYPKEMTRVRSNIMGGLIGAVETSNAAIVQSLHQLLVRPSVLAEARAAAADLADDEPIQKSRFASYVWEALRFHPINPFVVRTVEADTVVGSSDQALKLRQGTRVLVATHSAMHDPRTVRDPDQFIVDRPARDREMNLGYAMHRCLGDYVAEVMVPEVVRQLVLLPRLERVPPSPPVVVNQGIDFGPRGSFPEHYVVRFGEAAGRSATP